MQYHIEGSTSKDPLTELRLIILDDRPTIRCRSESDGDWHTILWFDVHGRVVLAKVDSEACPLLTKPWLHHKHVETTYED